MRPRRHDRFLVRRRQSAAKTRMLILGRNPGHNRTSLDAQAVRQIQHNHYADQCRMRLSPQLRVRRKSTALRTRKLRLRFALPHHRRGTPVVPTFQRAPLSLHGSSQPEIRLAQWRHARCRAQAGRQSNRPCAKAPHERRNRSQARGRHQGLKPLRSPNRGHNTRNNDPLRSPNRGHNTRSNDPLRRAPNPSTRIKDSTTTYVKNIGGWANATAAPRRAAVLLNRIPSLEPRA